MYDSIAPPPKAKTTQAWIDSINTSPSFPGSASSPLSPRSSLSPLSIRSSLSPISTSSTISPASSRPPRSPASSLFGSVRGIASTALRVAQQAIDAQDVPSSSTQQHVREPSSSRATTSNFSPPPEKLRSGAFAKDAVVALADAIAHPTTIDDRKMLLEDIITTLQTLPPNSQLGEALENNLVRLLWNDLNHPPSSYLGQAKYRSADGSGNNFQNPRLGAAGEPYARSVPPTRPVPHQLPDTADVFDSLMKRDKFVPHPSGISSLLFAFATCITHSLFNTNRQDPNINDASSYLDLSPLYGNNQEEQNGIRTFRNGAIFEDVIASQRLFLMPPSCCALMIVFSRNHNWIVDTLLRVNEHGRFKPLEVLSPEQQKRQDEDLFQTARLVNCGWFLQVIFHDYIRVILNINQTDSNWTLIPSKEMIAAGEHVARGVGNVVSVEFNLLYRWHSCIGEKDTEYIENLMKRYTRTPPEEMTREEFIRVVRGTAMEMGTDPKKWTFGGLKRTGKDGTGRFSDNDLVCVLTEATEEAAGAYKARGVPTAMKIIDIMGMDMARNEWACATLNEFRSFLKLAKYNSFEEWNPDPIIATAARELYGDIDNLEIVPGLAAEEPKPSQQGSGLAPGYTISRAILSDAVSLVRGDRFFTVDYTAGNLTSVLYRDLEADVENGAFGGALGKLLMRSFPRHYSHTSTYALFPFSTPSTTNGVLERLKLIDQYDTRRPGSPVEWIVIDQRSTAEAILSPESPYSFNFEPVYGAILDVSTQRLPSFLNHITACNTKARSRSAQEIIDRAFFPLQFANIIVAELAPKAKDLVSRHSWSYETGKMRLNVVQQVVIPICMAWISDQLGFPLKTDKDHRGLLTCLELYDTLSEAYAFVHSNFDPIRSFNLRQSVIKKTSILKSVIDFRLAEASGTSSKAHDLAQDVKQILLGEKSGQGIVMSNSARKLYDRVLESTSRPLDEISEILQLAMINFVSSVAACAKSIDFFLRPQNIDSLRDLRTQISADGGLSNDSTIQNYINESLRLDPVIGGVVRRAQSPIRVGSGSNANEIPAGSLLYLDLNQINRDPAAFPQPEQIRPDRSPTLYKLAEAGIRSSRGGSLNNAIALAVAKEVFSLSNLRRAAGKSGELCGLKESLPYPFETVTTYIHPKDQSLSFFPQSMVVLHGGREEDQVWDLLD